MILRDKLILAAWELIMVYRGFLKLDVFRNM